MQRGISKLESWLTGEYSVIASLAPSYLVEFEEDAGKVTGALIELGFCGIEETITVLPEIIEAREQAEKQSRSPIIYNSCPVIWGLIDSCYSGLKKYLLNIPSPMVLHSRRLKERFPGVKTVFIGPCEAKKWEQQRFYDMHFTDLVITFKELRKILGRNHIDMKNMNEGNFLSPPPTWTKACILYSLKSGVKDVAFFLKHFDTNVLDLAFKGMELLACKGGCINGPGMTIDKNIDERIQLYCEKTKTEKENYTKNKQKCIVEEGQNGENNRQIRNSVEPVFETG